MYFNCFIHAVENKVQPEMHGLTKSTQNATQKRDKEWIQTYVMYIDAADPHYSYLYQQEAVLLWVKTKTIGIYHRKHFNLTNTCEANC